MSNYNADQILNQSFDATLGALEISVEAGTPQAYGVDATGADGYATVLTVSGAKTHIAIQNTGTHPAIISLNSGTTDHFYIPGGVSAVFDNIAIADAATIQAKNGSAGNNYTGLYISVW